MKLVFKNIDRFPDPFGMYLYLDNEKYQLEDIPLVLNLDKNATKFYFKNWWMKSKTYNINSNSSIEVRRILNAKSFIILISVLLTSLIFSFFKVKYFDYLAIIFGSAWIIYYLFILSFGQKYYFKVLIRKD